MTTILFLDDLCRALRVSRRTVERLRRHGAFPVPELPALDKRPRWSSAAVDQFLTEQQSHTQRLRGRVRLVKSASGGSTRGGR